MVAIKRKVFALQDSGYADDLTLLGRTYHQLGNARRALVVLQEAVEAAKKHYGENTAAYALALSYLGLVHSEVGKIREAERMCADAIRILEAGGLTDSKEYGTCLTTTAELYLTMGRYPLAEDHARRGAAVHARTFGRRSIRYALDLG